MQSLRLKLIYVSLISTQERCFIDTEGSSKHSHTIACQINMVSKSVNRRQKTAVNEKL